MNILSATLNRMRYWVIWITALFLLTGVVFSQTQFWRDINGTLSYSLLYQSGNGTVFASYGQWFSEDQTYGLYSSSDNAANWMKTRFNDYISEVEGNGNIVIVVKPQQFTSNLRYYSSDNGVTWIQMNSNNNEPQYFNVTDSGKIYAIHEYGDGRVVTYDVQSKRWKSIGVVPSYGQVNGPQVFRIDHANNFYIGSTRNGLYISRNAGASWEYLFPWFSIGSIHITPDNKVVVGSPYVNSGIVHSPGGVYSSSDTGKSWDTLGLRSINVATVIQDSYGRLYANTSEGIYRYSGADTLWQWIGPRFMEFDDILFTTSNTLLASTSTQAMFRSTDFGETWLQAKTIREENISAICVDDNNMTYVGTLGDRIFITSNAGTGWNQVLEGQVGNEITSIAHSGSMVFAGTDEGLYRTTNHGVTWSNITSGYVGGAVYSIALNSHGECYIGTNFGVYHSSDSGNTWSNAGLAERVIPKIVVNTLDEIIAGTENDGIFLSSNNGGSWSYSGLSGYEISSLAVNGYGDLFVGGYGGIYSSTNKGNSWNQNVFDNSRVLTLVTRGNHVFAGTFNGVYRSVNNGSSWSALSQTGLNQIVVMALAFNSAGNLLAGTYQGGVYQSSDIITGVSDDVELPSTLLLSQNYPNPFNPTTTIRFTIPEAGFTSLKVYNLLGQEIATLVNERKLPAAYTVSWDAGNLPGGVYLYQLISGDFKETKKMVLLR